MAKKLLEIKKRDNFTNLFQKYAEITGYMAEKKKILEKLLKLFKKNGGKTNLLEFKKNGWKNY